MQDEGKTRMHHHAIAMAVCSILGTAATGGGLSLATVVGGSLMAAASALTNKLVSKTDRDDAQRDALESALNNQHLTRASANALKIAILDANRTKADHSVEKLAEFAADRWLVLHSQRDKRVRAYKEDGLADRIAEYLCSDFSKPAISVGEWYDILYDTLKFAPEILDVPQVRIRELSEYLEAHYAEHLYSAFKTDLRNGGEGFAGIVLRFLSHIFECVNDLRSSSTQAVDLSPLFARFEMLANIVCSQSKGLDRMAESIQRSFQEIAAFRAEAYGMLLQIPQEIHTVGDLVGDLIRRNESESERRHQEAMAEIRLLAQCFRGGSAAMLDRDYDSAIRVVALRHGLDTTRFRAWIDANVQKIMRDPTADIREKILALRESGRFTEARDFAVAAEREFEKISDQATMERIELCLDASLAEFSLGHYREARKLAEKAVFLADPDKAFEAWVRAKIEVGHALVFESKDREAEKTLTELLPVLYEKLGPENCYTLRCRRHLASALLNQDKNADAEKQLRDLLAINDRVFGADNPEALKARNTLAVSLYKQEKFEEWYDEQSAVLTISERVLGREHADTLQYRRNVAISLVKRDKKAEGEAEIIDVLAVRIRILGPEHPDTLTSRSDVARILRERGNIAEAEKEESAVVEIRERVLGPDHREAVDGKSVRAFSLSYQGREAEAEKAFREVLQILDETVGQEDVKAIENRKGLAKSLSGQGKNSESEREERILVAILSRTLGLEHADTLMARHWLAVSLHRQGRVTEAESEYQTVLMGQDRTLGPDHTDTTLTRMNLALVFSTLGKFSEAEEEYRAVLAVRERTLGQDHPDTAAVRQKLMMARPFLPTNLPIPTEATEHSRPCVVAHPQARTFGGVSLGRVSDAEREKIHELLPSLDTSGWKVFDTQNIELGVCGFWNELRLVILRHPESKVGVPLMWWRDTLRLLRTTNEAIYALLGERSSGWTDEELISLSKLFFATVIGSLGSFRIVENVGQVPWRQGAPDAAKEDAAKHIFAAKVIEDAPDGRRCVRAAVIFKNALFHTDILISNDPGNTVQIIELANEELLMEDLAVETGAHVSLVVQE